VRLAGPADGHIGSHQLAGSYGRGEKRRPQDGRIKTRSPGDDEMKSRLPCCPQLLAKGWCLVFDPCHLAGRVDAAAGALRVAEGLTVLDEVLSSTPALA